LLIALIPHVVRTPNLTDVDLKGVAAGTDQVVKVSYAPRVQAPPAAAPTGTEPPTPAPAPTVTTPVQPETPAAVQPPIPGVPGQAGPRLIFTPPASQVQLSAPLNMTLQAENVQELFTASPIRIKWDPAVLRLNEITPGEFLARDGQRVTSAKDIRNDSGEAWVTMNRLPGAGGVSGGGALVTFSFTAIGKGTTKVSVTDFGLKNAQLQPIVVIGPEVDITVQ
jgi:general secretion pathway protein D